MSPPPVRIFYLVPDDPHPSWGIGLLYVHVRLLRARGWRAFVLHHQSPFRLDWSKEDPPCRYLDDPSLVLGSDDVLVVPEALAGEAAQVGSGARSVLFVQGTYPLFAAIAGREAMVKLGFGRSITILPHAAHLLDRFFGVEAVLVPPCVASDFFVSPGSLDEPLGGRRERRVLLHVKDAYEQAGFPDRRILESLWYENAPDGWVLDRFSGLTHAQVAERMASSAFLVNLNVLEAFNTTVPEAMAAGCLVLCYEAIGGRDFLSDGDNASVFPNSDVVALAERLFSQLGAFERGDPVLAEQRRRARATADCYTEDRTGEALHAFFHGWLA